LTKPSLLVTFIGAGIGDVAIFDKPNRWHLAPNVAKLEPFNENNERIDIKYLLYYLVSKIGQSELFKFWKATAQPSLSMGTIRQAIVTLPPLAEQKRIVKKVDQLMNLCNELELRVKENQNNSELLMEAVLKEAFTS
jgi:type I restriction enzyme S subunit